MRYPLAIIIGVFLASPAWSQSFAPAQVRTLSPSSGSAEARVMPGLASLAMPTPAPFGLSGVTTPRQGFSGSVLLPGGQVVLPGSPGTPTTSRLYTIFGNDGSRSAIYYNPATGDTIGYDLSTSVGRFPRPYDGPSTAGLATEAGTGSFSGLTTNPSVTRLPSSGIPAINNLTPSFNYRANPYGYIGPPTVPSGTTPGFGSSPSLPTAPSTIGSP